MFCDVLEITGNLPEIERSNKECYLHGRITESELLRLKILHQLRRGNVDYAAKLAELEERNGLRGHEHRGAPEADRLPEGAQVS